MRPVEESSNENLYLVVGVRGDYSPRATSIPEGVDFALLHALDERWGIPVPWGACDSGCDLESSGGDVLRGWSHVDLRPALPHEDVVPQDVPAAGLLRSLWDSLELFGKTTLTGVDAIVPLACAGDRLRERVAESVLRDGARSSDAPSHAIVHAGSPWHDAPTDPWSSAAILDDLSQLTDVVASMERVEHVAYPAPTGPDPFAPSDPDLVRFEVRLPDWTIDDAAWLVEATSTSCRRAGVTGAIQIAVRLGSGGDV